MKNDFSGSAQLSKFTVNYRKSQLHAAQRASGRLLLVKESHKINIFYE